MDFTGVGGNFWGSLQRLFSVMHFTVSFADLCMIAEANKTKSINITTVQ